MSFNTMYRLSVHAAIFNQNNEVLLLKQSYGDKRWGLPGGGVEVGETLYDAICRECYEELGENVEIEGLTGFYYHKEFNAQVGIFLGKLKDNYRIKLSSEHTEYKFAPLDDLGEVQKIRVENAFKYNAQIAYRAF
jgi:8-oxo-dGTP pyrophosphatase MutT (NUDIX family)